MSEKTSIKQPLTVHRLRVAALFNRIIGSQEIFFNP